MRAASFEGYRGRFVQCDGYDAYNKLTKSIEPRVPGRMRGGGS